jgi:glycine hydroxymethyltransferase
MTTSVTATTTAELEVHEPAALARARAILDACGDREAMQAAVLEAVARNEQWRGRECIKRR